MCINKGKPHLAKQIHTGFIIAFVFSHCSHQRLPKLWSILMSVEIYWELTTTKKKHFKIKYSAYGSSKSVTLFIQHRYSCKMSCKLVLIYWVLCFSNQKMQRKKCLWLAIYFSKNRTAIKVVPHDVTDDISVGNERRFGGWCWGLSICPLSGAGQCV